MFSIEKIHDYLYLISYKNSMSEDIYTNFIFHRKNIRCFYDEKIKFVVIVLTIINKKFFFFF